MTDEKKIKPPGPGFYPVVFPKEEGVFMTLGPGGGGGGGAERAKDEERDSLVHRLLIENARMGEALREARPHVRRQQFGRHAQDREDATTWLDKWRDLFDD